MNNHNSNSAGCKRLAAAGIIVAAGAALLLWSLSGALSPAHELSGTALAATVSAAAASPQQVQRTAIHGGTPESALPPAVTEATPVPAWQGTGRLNLLFMGIDQRPTENADKAATDTMIVVSVDPATPSAGMVSLPRDLYVAMPGHGQGRINTAYGLGGAPYAMRVVQDTVGIPIQHYVRVDFEVLVTLVDMLGGIDVYVDTDINDPAYPDNNYGLAPFVLAMGWHHLDGATALKYARTRHQSSDFTRMRRQQQIIMAVRDRALSTDAITRLLPSAPLILGTLSSAIKTDLSLTQIVQLILFARDLPADKITRVVVDESAVQPWITPSGGQVLLPNLIRLRHLAGQMVIPPAPSAGDALTSTRVVIMNGTQQPELAATAQSFLQSRGYHVVKVSAATVGYARSVIIDPGGKSAVSQQLATLLGLPPSSVVVSAGGVNGGDATVILGNDFDLRRVAN